MVKIVNEKFQTVERDGELLENLNQSYAIDLVKEMYQELGLNNRLSGISVLSPTCVKVLTRHELDFIFDEFGMNFFHNRPYNNSEGAYIVTEDELRFIRDNVIKFHIMNDEF